MDGDDKFHQGRFLNSTYEADAEEEENDSNDEVQHEESYDLFYHHHEDNTSSYIAEIHPSSFISHPNSSKLTSQKSQKRSQSISGSCNGFFDELNVVELVEWKDLSEFGKFVFICLLDCNMLVFVNLLLSNCFQTWKRSFCHSARRYHLTPLTESMYFVIYSFFVSVI
jgi:hypothetical protein